MTVIASDSYSVEPLTVEAIITSAGERYDFVLHAPEDQNIGNCAIHIFFQIKAHWFEL